MIDETDNSTYTPDHMTLSTIRSVPHNMLSPTAIAVHAAFGIESRN